MGFLRLKSRRGLKKAILAAAASMLTAAYYILKDEVIHVELGFGQQVWDRPARAVE